MPPLPQAQPRLTLTTDKENTMAPKQNHHLTVTIDWGGTIRWSIICDATEGAYCRMWCDEGCEYGGPEHDEHTLRDQGACGIVPFFDDGDLIPEAYVGKETELRSGPVVITACSTGECEWGYAE